MRKIAPLTILAASHLALVLAVALRTEGLVRGSGTVFATDDSVASVVRSLPAGWAVLENRANEIPFGHYWGNQTQYRGQRGTLLVLIGPKPVSIRWCDADGRRHDDPIAVETLEVWLMPPAYRDWTVFLTLHGPVPPDRVFADARVRVYARPSSRLTISDQQFREEILARATFIGTPVSPLSWDTWRSDLRRELARKVE